MIVGIFATDPYDEISALLKAEILDDIRPKMKFSKPRERFLDFDLQGRPTYWRAQSAEALVFYEIPEARIPEVEKKARGWVRAFRFSELPDAKKIEAYRSLFRTVERYGERI